MSKPSWREELGVRKRRPPVDLDTLEYNKLLSFRYYNLILLLLCYSEEEREKILAKRRKSNAATRKSR